MRKLIIDLDPGIGDAFATVLALIDPHVDVLALTACAGCVTGSLATRNVQAVVAHLDPPKWPRLGSARGPSELADTSPGILEPMLGALHGPTGLGDIEFTPAALHNPHESSRVLIDLVRENPNEVCLLTLGPLANVVAAAERAPDFLDLLGRLVICGGSISAGGDVTAAAETNFFLNPEAARLVVSARITKTIIPLDVTARAVLAPEQFQRMTQADIPAARFLSKLLPVYFRSHHQLLGIEGIRIAEVVALAAVARPQLFRSHSLPVDVETEGELTRGASVADRRPQSHAQPRSEVVTEVDLQGVIDYATELLNIHQ